MNVLMMGGGMVLGEVISTFRLAFATKNLELPLANTIADPIKVHVDGFGSHLFYSVRCSASSAIVVSRHGRCWL